LGIEARQRLAVALLQLRFVIPRVHLAWSAVHEKPDDRFGARWKMRRLRRERVRGRAQASPGEQAVQREQTEARTGALQELAAGDKREQRVHELNRILRNPCSGAL